jgi:hypothetical protein
VRDTFKPDYQAHPDGGVLRELARLTGRNAELQEQLAAAESHADDLNVLVLEQADKIKALRVVLEGAEYERIDDMVARGPDLCRKVGEAAAERTKALRAVAAAAEEYDISFQIQSLRDALAKAREIGAVE